MYRRYLCVFALGLLWSAGPQAPAARAADAGIWKVAPPPPASWERDRVADLTARRHAAMEQIGDKSILILYAAEPRNYAGDVDWPFRQENDFFYLTAIPQPGSALVLIPGAEKIREILFLPPSNPAQENWTGHILTRDEGRKISGIQEVWDARLLNSFLSTLIPPARDILAEEAAQASRGGRGGREGRGGAAAPPPTAPLDVNAEFSKIIESVTKGETLIHMMRGRPAEYRREIEFAGKLTGAGLTVKDASGMFNTLRRVKSQRETEILQHAVEITAEAFQRVYALGVPGTWEYELQAQFEFTFLRRNAHWGYPCIVASGVNATTLHYETNKDRMKAGDLLLMDDAAEFDGYSVDVTRTIPVTGKYTKEQVEIYRLVWEAQQAGFRMALPGHTPAGNPTSVQGAANEVFKQGLFKLGLITDVTSDQQLRIWFNHGISHGIGLNVHDSPGGKELQPGMVITVEPGIYIRPDALDNLPKTPENEKFIEAVRPAFEKYKGIGVRIEDDVLITAGVPKVLSSGIPSKLEDVEATIAQLRKAQKSTPLP
ncbi:MAG: aminopeptidase P N-terminal domain-containing protein [Acidobacteriia bacterium]|nr:aminopeptidase P N-terminal domain-containing protein [Terriglobia bacterium]